MTALDTYGNVATGYTGDHALTFGGASTIGTFGPTATDKTGSATAFGAATTLTFTNGVSTAGGSARLYKAETASVTVTDGTHGNGSGASFTVSPAAAATLAVTSVDGGSTPTAGIGFPVVVQSLDAYGNRSGVVGTTGFSLSRAAGTGALGGTGTGSITAGQSQTTVAGVTYSKAEDGVQIAATRTSGDALSAGTSASFAVSSLADRLVVTSVNSG